MKEAKCEDVMIAAMAIADGEETDLTRTAVEGHTALCEGCRGAVEGMAISINMLGTCRRAELEADLWPRVEKRIAPVSKFPLIVLIALGSVLTTVKLFEILPKDAPGYAYKLVPLIAAAAVFVLLRDNPFQIKTEIILEK